MDTPGRGAADHQADKGATLSANNFILGRVASLPSPFSLRRRPVIVKAYHKRAGADGR